MYAVQICGVEATPNSGNRTTGSKDVTGSGATSVNQ